MTGRPLGAALARPTVLVLAALWVAGPLLPLAVQAFTDRWFYPDLWPARWSLTGWRQALGPQSRLAEAVATSVGIGAAVAALATALGAAAGRALAWYRLPGRRLIELILLVPVLVPPFAVAMGAQVVYLRAGLADSVTGVVLAQLPAATAYATLLMSGVWAGVDPALERQARTLGAGPWRAFREISLPQLRGGLTVAAMFAFLISWSDYLLTLLIGGGVVSTVPLLLFATAAGSGNQAATAAIALVAIAPPLLLTALAARQLAGRDTALLGVGR
ncbi:ABC transporter permease subunit [Solwaraspora sp. WMMD1047]|uniref:ABC transporter permease n=1 Tax=Solwaraspora sp. WMMD1047 TaxID=3016102 RepID=UPI0024170882|nr:ABC transporter permease subunit [Solwaraspora sp. WMMD1047]MDG4828243.1 ABC transporter permease subunit [Solwaraspora sp. WMMD1047]